MSKPKRQHFIPKSYLKNFAIQKGEKHFIEGKLKTESKPRPQLLSTKDVCVEKNLYTIPNLSTDNKYAIEKFYAEKVDSIYPEVYNRLIDPSVVFISQEERAKILMTTMSLFFRTPKFLNLNETKIDEILSHAVANCRDKTGEINITYMGANLNFHIDNIETIKAELKAKNKIKFLSEHLEDWHKFTRYKMDCAISVFRIYEDTKLITSDNPVAIHSIIGGGLRDIFDPTNMINLPLDSKHFLTIFPNSEGGLVDRILRGDRDKYFALLTNYQNEQNCEDWILGYPESVTQHVYDQNVYGAHTADNYERIEGFKEKAIDLTELNKLMNSAGGFDLDVATKILQLRNKKLHKNDPEMRKLIVHMFKIGVLK